MNRFLKLTLPAVLVIALCTARPARAADSLDAVLHQLDVAAARFHTTSADFVFESVQTDPIPDTDTQKGSVYYERKGGSFQMAAHIQDINGHAVPKIYKYAGGVFELYEPVVNQVTRFARAGKFESYVMLGFGASGKDLADKWTIKLAGTETIDSVKTDKLELIAKDPAVRRNLPRVTIWIDPQRGVSLKQVFDETGGTERTCTYLHIRVNDSLPHDAFTFKTNRQTQYVDH